MSSLAYYQIKGEFFNKSSLNPLHVKLNYLKLSYNHKSRRINIFNSCIFIDNKQQTCKTQFQIHFYQDFPRGTFFGSLPRRCWCWQKKTRPKLAGLAPDRFGGFACAARCGALRRAPRRASAASTLLAARSARRFIVNRHCERNSRRRSVAASALLLLLVLVARGAIKMMEDTRAHYCIVCNAYFAVGGLTIQDLLAGPLHQWVAYIMSFRQVSVLNYTFFRFLNFKYKIKYNFRLSFLRVVIFNTRIFMQMKRFYSDLCGF